MDLYTEALYLYIQVRCIDFPLLYATGSIHHWIYTPISIYVYPGGVYRYPVPNFTREILLGCFFDCLGADPSLCLGIAAAAWMV